MSCSCFIARHVQSPSDNEQDDYRKRAAPYLLKSLDCQALTSSHHTIPALLIQTQGRRSVFSRRARRRRKWDETKAAITHPALFFSAIQLDTVLASLASATSKTGRPSASVASGEMPFSCTRNCSTFKRSQAATKWVTITPS